MNTPRFMSRMAAVLALGCASGNPSPSDAATASVAPRPCTVSPAGVDSTWQEVRAAGFTFCLPGSWRPQGGSSRTHVDARTWRSGSASITWGTGIPPARRVTVTETAIVRQGEPLPPPRTRADTRRDTEMIGGHLAEVSEVHYPDLHHTEAMWREPSVYLQGEATSAVTAQLLLVIHRTARFPATRSP